jgi:hypothetical protein
MNDLLGMRLGSCRKKATIVDIKSEKYDPNDKNDKLYIMVKSPEGTPFKVSEVWIRNHRQEIEVKGLWLHPDHTGTAVSGTSLFGRLMQYLSVREIKDLIGKEVFLEPKTNGFMAIVLYD